MITLDPHQPTFIDDLIHQCFRTDPKEKLEIYKDRNMFFIEHWIWSEHKQCWKIVGMSPPLSNFNTAYIKAVQWQQNTGISRLVIAISANEK